MPKAKGKEFATIDDISTIYEKLISVTSHVHRQKVFPLTKEAVLKEIQATLYLLDLKIHKINETSLTPDGRELFQEVLQNYVPLLYKRGLHFLENRGFSGTPFGSLKGQNIFYENDAFTFIDQCHYLWFLHPQGKIQGFISKDIVKLYYKLLIRKIKGRNPLQNTDKLFNLLKEGYKSKTPLVTKEALLYHFTYDTVKKALKLIYKKDPLYLNFAQQYLDELKHNPFEKDFVS